MKYRAFAFLALLTAACGEEFSAPSSPTGAGGGSGSAGNGAGAAGPAGDAGSGGSGQAGAPGGNAGFAGAQGGSAGVQGGAAGAANAGNDGGGQAGVAGGGGDAGAAGGGDAGAAGGGGDAGAAGTSGNAGAAGAGGGACEPGTFSCNGTHMLGCKGTPPAWVEVLDCPGERCVADTGVCLPCTPGEAVGCFNAVSLLVCTSEGKSDESSPCPEATPWCDKGSCKVCLEDKHCTLQGDPACASVRCEEGVCVQEKSAAGTTVGTLAASDCKRQVCDGDGQVITVADPADPPGDDGNPCTLEGCSQDQPVTSFADASVACTTKGKPSVCDGQGGCLTCVEGTVRCGEDGKSQETCTEGDWKPTPCPAGAPICSQDQCIGIKHLALGDNHSCALFQDGHVRCWGSNTAGQLGNGQDGISYQNPATVVVGLNNAVQLAAGARHTCALLADGTLSCWGDNTRGQLGNDKDATAYTPRPVVFDGVFTQIAAGGRNTCARTTDKKLWCWGDNSSLQIYGVYELYKKPTNMYFDPVDQFAVGEDFLCAKVSGGVLCRGKNDWQQVGGTPSHLHDFDPFKSINELALGKNHGCIRSTHPAYNGAITCWGSPTNNKRGSFFLQGQYTNAVAFTTGGNTLTLGHEHTCQIAPEPNVYVECFGDTSSYQLGNDQLILQKAVVSSVGATLLAAGSLHTCAYSPEKGLFCWGDNELGQSGSGGSGKNKFPTPVLWLS